MVPLRSMEKGGGSNDGRPGSTYPKKNIAKLKMFSNSQIYTTGIHIFSPRITVNS